MECAEKRSKLQIIILAFERISEKLPLFTLMKTYQASTKSKKLLGDILTPVSIYRRLRDHFTNTVLLESSDYHGNENTFTYICCEPVAKFELFQGAVIEQYPDGFQGSYQLDNYGQALPALQRFVGSFREEENNKHKVITNGLFGYIAYDSVQYFEDIRFKSDRDEAVKIPDILYQVYRYVIAFNHFNEEIFIFEHTFAGEKFNTQLDKIERLLEDRGHTSYNFECFDKEFSNFTDASFLEIIKKGKEHCQLGDVFQVVLSRRFQQKFRGDDFNVYRALRSINPSPYLFYFDYGNFKIFGSSPEAQIVVHHGQATIYPIAGTFLRTGDDEKDAELARKLFSDPKENSEHIMLVDLARNDLSRHASNVTVTTFKEIQYFSHVIHLVSKVTGQTTQKEVLKVVGDTFPAGTLSGAPKYKAIELIDRYEETARSYYGGCIGMINFGGNFNHAIMIRSFLSKNNTLFYQAGAGVVAKSKPESEVEEVNNKLLALRKAMELAKNII